MFDARVRAVSGLLLREMQDSGACTLSAPQVGEDWRVIVVKGADEGDAPVVYVNPDCTWRSDHVSTKNESCLSAPGACQAITRPDRIVLQWRTISGQVREAQFEDQMARRILHAIDHLDGTLICDKKGAAP